MPLQGVMNVMDHFNNYMDIPQIKQLADQVTVILDFSIYKFQFYLVQHFTDVANASERTKRVSFLLQLKNYSKRFFFHHLYQFRKLAIVILFRL